MRADSALPPLQTSLNAGMLELSDPDAIVALRDLFRSVDYSVESIRTALATEGPFMRDPLELPFYLKVLPENETLSTMIKLFRLGVPVDVDEAAAALAPLELERLERVGLLVRDGGSVVSSVSIAPSGELLLASDWEQEDEAPHRQDQVLGISAPTRVLANLTVRQHVDSALDIGTGCGVQALLAARHTRAVTAIDINPRAVEFGQFNVLLNASPNVEFRQGDLFEPVDGETFDLIVCNPPYVISPETDYAFRDSGLPGDSFCEGLVRRLPEFLNEDGFAHVLVSWVHGPGDWETPLRAWVEDSGCDAILFHYVTHEPVAYAAGWGRLLGRDPEVFGAAVERWSEYYERLGIEAIAWGAVILRRREGENWIWAHSPATERISPGGEQVLRLFQAQDFLAAVESEQDFLNQSFSLAEDHRLEQTARLGSGSREVERTVLKLDGGLGFRVAVDAASLEVLARLDGERSLDSVFAEVAREAPGAPTAEEFAAAAVPALTRLIELGLVVPGPAAT
jgi:methylase of polypeptide subunit release factors